MAMNQYVFLHETDKAALDALKAIPGFSQVTKAFMNSWSEKLMHMENMASYIRISEKQLPKYYEMLKEISKKLGIETPDLFLKLDVVPNAYTSGDTKPFIVMTSALLETLPEELIPTVLAHECGHIVCHHVLYRTMGSMILSGALTMMPLSAAVIYPVMAAFRKWMRCSELSADRVAVLCDGSSDHLIELCMRFAGFTKNISGEMNVEVFMEQAEEYNRLTQKNVLNKTLEQMRFSQLSHPIHAVRAYECRNWTQSNEFILAKEYFDSYQQRIAPSKHPVSFQKKSFSGKSAIEAGSILKELGFSNIRREASTQNALFMKENDVIETLVNGSGDYKEGEWIDADALITLKYYRKPAAQEKKNQAKFIRLMHSDDYYSEKTYEEAAAEFSNAGFKNIILRPVCDLSDSDDVRCSRIIAVRIGENTSFRKSELVADDVEIIISYHAVSENS